MKVLYLGPGRPEFESYLRSIGDEVLRTDKRMSGKAAILRGVDWIVSYGYRHILKEDVLDRFPQRVVNLHISYLPWNRGADPNLWSFLEDSPKGVTVHFIDTGVDTGLLIAQQEVPMAPDDTLRSSYERLTGAIERLFREVWPRVRAGELTGTPQPDGGSVHRVADKEPYLHLMTVGWDTPVATLAGKALVAERG